MNEPDLAGLLNQYVPTTRRRWWFFYVVATCIGVLLPLAVLLLPSAGDKLSDRASIAAVLLTATAFAATAWQFRAQRIAAASEAYFARLDLPNERRLAFFGQVLAVADRVDQPTLASALEQHFVFYVFAELDNLEYVLRKFEDGHTDSDLTLRAVRVFESRCEQSRDFRSTARAVLGRSGYEPRFVSLVETLMARCALPAPRPPSGVLPAGSRNPMRYDELDVVRHLRAAGGATTKPGELE